MTVIHDLGVPGHFISYFVQDKDSDDIIGCIETHPSLKDTQYHKIGEPCSGPIFFDVPNCVTNKPKWKVESWEPLTLSPSVFCTLCGNHGFIKNGKWE